jgi:hypothetical protein
MRQTHEEEKDVPGKDLRVANETKLMLGGPSNAHTEQSRMGKNPDAAKFCNQRCLDPMERLYIL